MLTATATDLVRGSTSEFSNCVPIEVEADVAVPTLGSWGLATMVLLIALAGGLLLTFRPR